MISIVICPTCGGFHGVALRLCTVALAAATPATLGISARQGRGERFACAIDFFVLYVCIGSSVVRICAGVTHGVTLASCFYLPGILFDFFLFT